MNTRFHGEESSPQQGSGGWKSAVFLVLLVAALAVLVSCLLVRPGPQDPPGSAPQDPWLGESMTSDSCPPVPGWEAEPLFDDRSVSEGAWNAGLCRYLPSDQARLEDLEELVGSELHRVGRDRKVIVPLGEPACDTGNNSQLEELFLQQAGSLPAQSSPVRLPGNAAVRLVLIDNHPDETWPLTSPQSVTCSASPFSTPSRHGYDLALMARSLLCSEGKECAVEIATRLALTEPKGCHFTGYIADVAKAVRTELDAWRASDRSQRLVFNLSVGWDPMYGDIEGEVSCRPGAAATSSLPAKAVYCSLKEATCSGALVLAAAGNRGGSGQSNGPALPAGWERQRPLTADFCADVLPARDEQGGEILVPSGQGIGAGSSTSAPSTSAPSTSMPSVSVVYAVGGVQADGAALVNSRPNAEPRRVAYGDHALVGDDMCPYTGTSVSTVVVSSAAAAVWAANPGMSSIDVIQRVDQSGDSMSTPPLLARSAEFHPGVNAAAVRMISVAGAHAGAGVLDRGPNTGLLTVLPVSSVSCSSVASLALTSADHPLKHFPASLSPERVNPSPQVVPCPPCTELTSGPTSLGSPAPTGSQLLIRIHPEWSAGSIEEAWLEAGSNLFSINLPAAASPLTPGSCLLANLGGSAGKTMSLLLKVRTDSGEEWVSDNPVFRRIVN